MEKKKEYVMILEWAKYVAFIFATVCVFVFQFIAEPICITLALSLYVVAFGLMFATSVIHCVEIYNADKEVKKDHAIVIDNGDVIRDNAGEDMEVVNIKAEKVWSVLGAVFFGLFTLFTFVVLVLF